ncbi:MAG: peptide deformylase [Dehalococcoidales bacterium]|jgi:peptide deformylase|nr:peptide deformylase [Dehalococcoidales bacterium]
MTILKVVCAWCGKDLGEKDGQGTEGISHGICKDCLAKQLADRVKVSTIHPCLVMVPDERLRRSCEEVVEGEVLTGVLGLMKEVLEACRRAGINTISIAAPQVGIMKKVFIIDSPSIEMVVINPVVTKTSGKQVNKEGCLSFPVGVYYRVERPNIVKFRYQNSNGFTRSMKFHDIYAAAVLHEIDHIEGILMDDRGLPY